MGDAEAIRFEGGSERFDHVGAGMGGGEIVARGRRSATQAGTADDAAAICRSRGNAGAFAASGLKGGRLEIDGDAGDRLGAPLAGEMAGMSPAAS